MRFFFFFFMATTVWIPCQCILGYISIWLFQRCSIYQNIIRQLVIKFSNLLILVHDSYNFAPMFVFKWINFDFKSQIEKFTITILSFIKKKKKMRSHHLQQRFSDCQFCVSHTKVSLEVNKRLKLFFVFIRLVFFTIFVLFFHGFNEIHNKFPLKKTKPIILQ